MTDLFFYCCIQSIWIFCDRIRSDRIGSGALLRLLPFRRKGFVCSCFFPTLGSLLRMNVFLKCVPEHHNELGVFAHKTRRLFHKGNIFRRKCSAVLPELSSAVNFGPIRAKEVHRVAVEDFIVVFIISKENFQCCSFLFVRPESSGKAKTSETRAQNYYGDYCQYRRNSGVYFCKRREDM